MSGIGFYLTGLIIVSFSIGIKHDTTDGWMALGVGLIGLSILISMIKYLNGIKGE